MTHLFASFAFRGWFPLWAAVLMGIIGTAAALLAYRSEAGATPFHKRLPPAILRSIIFAAILFLLLRPTIITETVDTLPRPIALLVDDTQSMSINDPRPNFLDQWRTAIAFDKVDPGMTPTSSSGEIPSGTPEKPARIEVLKAVLSNPRLKLVEKLAKIGPVQPSTISAARAIRDPKDARWIDTLTAHEPRTAFYDAVFDLINREETELPSAIVLMTDGRDNASTRGADDLAKECLRAGIPLHIYVIGSASAGQVRVRGVKVGDTLFVDDTVVIPIDYSVRGFSGARIRISVSLSGREVASKTVDGKLGDNLHEDLAFVPNKSDAQVGKQDLTVSIKVEADEGTASDETTKAVRVVDRKVKVLVFDSLPRWDFKFIQRGLLRDRRVEARFILTEGDRRAMESEPFLLRFPNTLQELLTYDLIIVGDVSAQNLTTEQMRFIRDFVVEGGGFIQIAGRTQGPASFVGTPLAEILPVEFRPARFAIDSGTRPVPYRPELTPFGARSPLLRFVDDEAENGKVWKSLPEMYWAYPVDKAKPAADVLATHPTMKTVDGKPMPVLAAHYYGKGYVLFCGFDETWRWRYNEAEKYFGRFWSQAVYLAGVSKALGTKLTQLTLDTSDPLLGGVGQVYARMMTSDLKPVKLERVDAKIERLNAGPNEDRSTPIELHPVPGQPGDFTAVIPFSRVGKYSLKVDSGSDPATLEYRVSLPPQHELAPGGPAESELARLAAATKGKLYHEEDLASLPDNIVAQTAEIKRHEEKPFWNLLVMLILIGLFTAEWLLRKNINMS